MLKNLIRKYFESKRTFYVFVFDIIAVMIGWYAAFIVATNFGSVGGILVLFGYHTLPAVLVVQLSTYKIFNVYRHIWHFSSLRSLVKIIQAVLLADGVLVGINYFFQLYPDLPVSIFAIYPLILVALWSSSRIMVRVYYERQIVSHPNKNLLVIGGGKAAELFIRDLSHAKNNMYRPLIILDDDISLHGREIHNVKVVGPITMIGDIVKKYQFDMVVIAIPSLTKDRMQEVLAVVGNTNLLVRSLPSLDDITSGKVAITQLRSVPLEDLLGRDLIQLNDPLIHNSLKDKIILVTGGGGSIGSELCRQIASIQPKKLIIVDHSEYNLYQLDDELCYTFPSCDIELHLANITDKASMEYIFSKYHPDIVYHAAAYKHVPMLENQIREAMKNNFYGTKILAELSAQFKVKKFIMVSTDKAVNPTNIMGATKRAAEIFCQNYNQIVSTQFITVRFGNVLGSMGSVIPRFKMQLEKGGPLTVTHPDIERYFMMIPEACQLILQASFLGNGGEIFVLDMGKPIKIIYLAELFIKLSGKVPYKDIDIIFTGLRPGEKLYEELFHDKESLQETDCLRIFKSNSRSINWDNLQQIIENLATYINGNDQENLVNILNELVPEYRSFS